MPFDGTSFPHRPERHPPQPPSDNAVSVLIIVFALGLLVMPISMAALIDIVRYIRGS